MNVFCAALDRGDAESAPLTLLVRCHGGLTYADKGEHCGDAASWWLGFDCAHSGDLCPKYPSATETYRDVDYVIAQARKAAGDIAKFAKDTA